MSEPITPSKIHELFNTLNDIQGLVSVFDNISNNNPYVSKALTGMAKEINNYHSNLKKATDAIQLLEPIMQKYRDTGYNILCEMFDYFERSEWRLCVKYSIIHDNIKFVVNLYVKDANTNAYETVIGTNYCIKENGGTYSYSESVIVSKMSIDTFKKSVNKYDKLIHDICELFNQYPLNTLDNAKLFIPEFRKMKINK